MHCATIESILHQTTPALVVIDIMLQIPLFSNFTSSQLHLYWNWCLWRLSCPPTSNHIHMLPAQFHMLLPSFKRLMKLYLEIKHPGLNGFGDWLFPLLPMASPLFIISFCPAQSVGRVSYKSRPSSWLNSTTTRVSGRPYKFIGLSVSVQRFLMSHIL